MATPSRDTNLRVNKAVRESVRDVGRHTPASGTRLALKRRMRGDLKLFLRKMFPERFYRPFSADLRRFITQIQQTILDGGQEAIALPRGEGKTTILACAALWAILCGHRRYVVVIGSDQAAAEKILDGIRAALDSSEALLEHYPEACHYAKALDGLPQRAAGQLAGGEPTGIRWRSDSIVLPQVPMDGGAAEVCAGAAIEARGLTGRVRGLQQTLKDGTILRPDFVFLDDPQTRESATSPAQCDEREDLIKSDVAGLAGIGGKQIAMVIACTVIAEGDLADRVLQTWHAVRAKALIKFPDAADTLWREYVRIRREARKLGNQNKAGNAFYKKNRKEMDAGAVVGNPHRKNQGELSALQHVYNWIADNGESSFRAELQNEPQAQESALYTINPAIVGSRLNGLDRCQAPEDAHFVLAGVDVNFYALNWCVAAVSPDGRAYLIDYGRYPSGRELWTEGSAGTPERAIFDGIGDLAGQLHQRHERLGWYGVDGNYATDTIYRAVEQQDRVRSFRCVVMRGVSSEKYSEPGDTKRRIQDGVECFLGKGVRGIHVVFNSHYWHKALQQGFLLQPGTVGSVSLWGRGEEDHRTFAAHVCADRLVGVSTDKGREIHKWTRRATERNDLADAAVMALAPASLFGAIQLKINPAAPAQQTQVQQPRQRVRHINL